MRHRAITPALALVAAGLACWAAPAALAQPALQPCANGGAFDCGSLAVPLDPSGSTPGTIALALRRRAAAALGARTAVIALAGGPGQAATPYAEEFLSLLGPLLSTRDLIVFDQRGTGQSDPLHCAALEHPSTFSRTQAIARCASEIGPSRAFFTTRQSVADIEAIRRAFGYEKLVLYGTSYGTKVALQYAADHPEHVEALILDSVVGENGPEPIEARTLEAVAPMLRRLCAGRACAGVGSDPARDLARVLAHVRRRALWGREIEGDGRAQRILITPYALLRTIVEGDLEPLLRSELPAALSAAAHGDAAPLARLVVGAGRSAAAPHGIDLPLYYATTCEELAFPWSNSEAPGSRIQSALRAAGALPASVLWPFEEAELLPLGPLSECAGWPAAGPAPALDRNPLPAVPSLILSGEDDLRTPPAVARSVASQIPGARLLSVPDTGHSVLGSEPTPCALRAVRTFLSSAPVLSCPRRPLPALLREAPRPPLSLAQMPGAPRGRSARTAEAVRLTLADLDRHLRMAARAQPHVLPGGAVDTGGLRAGWARWRRGLSLHRYTYVPGVALSGRLAPGATLRVGGRAAATGTLRLRGDSLTGALGGHRVRLRWAGI